LVRGKRAYPPRRGRPPIDARLAALIGRMARESPGWGYQRIPGDLPGLGYRVSAATIRPVLQRLRAPPAPRRRDATCRQFLRTPAACTLACDFCHAGCAVTLTRVYVLFALEAGSRYVHILGVTTNPGGAWTVQQARNLLTCLGDHARQFRILIGDRAGQFTGAFDAVLTSAGIEVVTIPPRSPRADASARRWLLTVRSELTGRMLSAGRRDLRTVLDEYAAH